ncbi:DUF2256 domain-containing protein [bacterium]|nr:DUF2256 domain-containing protein [bacterium]
MPQAKSNRVKPSRICKVCDRPFEWRKAWERDWQNVKYCSDRCRRTARRKSRIQDLDSSNHRMD